MLRIASSLRKFSITSEALKKAKGYKKIHAARGKYSQMVSKKEQNTAEILKAKVVFRKLILIVISHYWY